MVFSEIALKEWAVVVEALASGEQVLLLRKGGIEDPQGGFRLEHREFLLYPSWEHQKKEMVRPEFQRIFPQQGDPRKISFRLYAGIAFSAPVSDPAQLSGLEKYHIWTPSFFESRLKYHPQEPALLALLRVYRLHQPAAHPVRPEYAGCRSWVKLAQPVFVSEAQPVIENRRFRSILEEISARLEKKRSHV
ncbi:MAG: DUF1802 family protein [Candidatus Omnitrophica bacterium]|nr:DUF1802 family protein [Candidatus Omnitrophota bacterium]